MHAAWLCAFLLLAATSLVKADQKVATSHKNSVSPVKLFSSELTEWRGIDWSPWTALEAIQDPKSIPTARKTFVSPDKKFSMQTAIPDRELHFMIKDVQTGSVTDLASAYCPVFSVEWSPDSNSILTVVHAAHTSLIDILHYNGHEWLQFNINVPGDFDNSHVTKWEFKADHIKATYIVDSPAEKGRVTNLNKYTFDLDPTNGNVWNVVRTPITLKEYVSLRTALN